MLEGHGNRERGSNRERDRQRQTDRQTDRQRHGKVRNWQRDNWRETQ